MAFYKWENKYEIHIHSRKMSNEYNLKMAAFEIWSMTMCYRKY